MSNPIAGWYPDPSGDPSRLRYWDGTSWTEHYAPVEPATRPEQPSHEQPGGQHTEQYSADQPTEQFSAGQPTEQLSARADQTAAFPAATAGSQAQPEAAGAAGTQGYYGQQQPYGHQQAQQSYAPQQSFGQQPTQAYGQQAHPQQPYGSAPHGSAPYGAPPQREGEGRSGTGLIIGIIVAAVVLLAAVVVAIVMLLGGNDSEPATTPPPTSAPSPTGAPTPETTPEDDQTTTPPEQPGGVELTGALALGEPLDVDLAGSPSWTGTLEITEATTVVLDVVADAEDLTIELTGNGITATNDDRGQFHTYGHAMSIDPIVLAALEPGEYEVTVGPYTGQAARAGFTITAFTPEVFTEDTTVPVELAEASGWLGVVEVSEETLVTIDVVSEDGDPYLALLLADGTIDGIDDSSDGAGGSQDPYLEVLLPAGSHALSLTDYFDDPVTAELSVIFE